MRVTTTITGPFQTKLSRVFLSTGVGVNFLARGVCLLYHFEGATLFSVHPVSSKFITTPLSRTNT